MDMPICALYKGQPVQMPATCYVRWKRLRVYSFLCSAHQEAYFSKIGAIHTVDFGLRHGARIGWRSVVCHL